MVVIFSQLLISFFKLAMNSPQQTTCNISDMHGQMLYNSCTIYTVTIIKPSFPQAQPLRNNVSTASFDFGI